jgi:rubrerythrin
MRLTNLLERRRHRVLWNDPVRRFQTLLSFAETEEHGGKELVAAARRISDPELREHVLRHADDEVRHAELFRRRAAELREEAGGSLERGGSDKAYDLSRGGAGDLNAHGFFDSDHCDSEGEVSYIAMLHVAEQQAAELFAMHHSLTEHDPRTQQVFAEILKDEKYHVAYTGRFLERWRRAGLGKEVDEGLDSAKSSRLWGSWKRLGLRLGANLSKIILRVLYWTVLLPFGLLARRSHPGSEWRPAAARSEQPQGYEAQY